MIHTRTLIPTVYGWLMAGNLSVGEDVLTASGVGRVEQLALERDTFGYHVDFVDANSDVLVSSNQMWLLSNGKLLNTSQLHALLNKRQFQGRPLSVTINNPEPLEMPDTKNLKYEAAHIGRVVGTKRNVPIPIEYRRGSLQQRKEVLGGIMETGGTYNPSRRRCSFIVRRPETADSVLELLVTFGVTPQLTLEKNRYRIEWTPPFNPFLDGRDIETRVTAHSTKRTVKSVRSIQMTHGVRVVTSTGTILAGPLMVPLPAA